MPPKRKGAAAKKAPAGKKAKVVEEEAGPSDIQKTIEALKKSSKGKKTYKVDSLCRLAAAGEVSDKACCRNKDIWGGHYHKIYPFPQIHS